MNPHLNPLISLSCLSIAPIASMISNLRICLAVNNHLVFKLFRSGYIEVVFLREPVVPAAIPRREPIGVSLPGSRKGRARQRLHVDVPVGIRICSKICLCFTCELAAASIMVAIANVFRISSLLGTLPCDTVKLGRGDCDRTVE